MRIWQSVGLADRLQRDMLPDRPLTCVDANGVPFIDDDEPRGAGIRRSNSCISRRLTTSSARVSPDFGHVEVLLEHECLRVDPKRRWSNSCWPTCAPTRSSGYARLCDRRGRRLSPTRGQLGVGYTGRTYTERWVVIDTKVITEWDGHDRLRFHCNPGRPDRRLSHSRWAITAGNTRRAQARTRRNY